MRLGSLERNLRSKSSRSPVTFDTQKIGQTYETRRKKQRKSEGKKERKESEQPRLDLVFFFFFFLCLVVWIGSFLTLADAPRPLLTASTSSAFFRTEKTKQREEENLEETRKTSGSKPHHRDNLTHETLEVRALFFFFSGSSSFPLSSLLCSSFYSDRRGVRTHALALLERKRKIFFPSSGRGHRPAVSVHSREARLSTSLALSFSSSFFSRKKRRHKERRRRRRSFNRERERSVCLSAY